MGTPSVQACPSPTLRAQAGEGTQPSAPPGTPHGWRRAAGAQIGTRSEIWTGERRTRALVSTGRVRRGLEWHRGEPGLCLRGSEGRGRRWEQGCAGPALWVPEPRLHRQWGGPAGTPDGGEAPAQAMEIGRQHTAPWAVGGLGVRLCLSREGLSVTRPGRPCWGAGVWCLGGVYVCLRQPERRRWNRERERERGQKWGPLRAPCL